MRMTRRLAIIIAVVCGGLAALLLYVYLQSLKEQMRPVEVPKQVEVVVPIETIPAGTIVEPSMVATQQMSPEEAKGAATSTAQVSGRESLRDLLAGHPILTTDTRAIPPDLAYQVPEGMRAVTVELTSIVGVGDFLKAGDWVDVIATFEVGDTTVTRTVLQNVKLLAVGSTTVRTEEKKTEADAAGAAEAKTETYPHATLAVTPEDAQTLVFSDARGKLRLALRAKRETVHVSLGPTDSDDVIGAQYMTKEEAPPEAPPEVTPPVQADLTREPTRPAVEVIRGPDREIVTPVTP